MFQVAKIIEKLYIAFKLPKWGKNCIKKLTEFVKTFSICTEIVKQFQNVRKSNTHL